MGEDNWSITKFKVKVWNLRGLLYPKDIMKKYKLVIEYDPKTDKVDSIKEYIIEDEVEFIVEDREITVPKKLAEMIMKYCQDSIIGIS